MAGCLIDRDQESATRRAPGRAPCSDKYVTISVMVTTMDIYDEQDDLADDDDVTVHRAKAQEEIDRIAQQVRQALTEQGIDIPLFFLIPNSGDSILAFGTPGDPDDHLWNRVGEIVSGIVRRTVGLDRTRCRPIVCATTSDRPAGADEADGR
jgi:hypothetical protein